MLMLIHENPIIHQSPGGSIAIRQTIWSPLRPPQCQYDLYELARQPSDKDLFESPLAGGGVPLLRIFVSSAAWFAWQFRRSSQASSDCRFEARCSLLLPRDVAHSTCLEVCTVTDV
jgi:putative component of membrane protein insertase Oxa1/YidC/SpoIIIJ protein YidD